MKYALTIFCWSLVCLLGYADNTTDSSDDDKDREIKHIIKRSPGRKNISIFYNDGVICVSSHYKSEDACIIITNMETGQQNEFSINLCSGYAESNILLLPGEYKIEVLVGNCWSCTYLQI